MKYLRPTPPIFQQRGAVFIVMLVIMIMGVTFFLVSALSKVSLQTARNEISADLLAQSKDAVIGYAINNIGRPGNLPFPDRLVGPPEAGGPSNYDGDQDGCPGLSGCLGRLPWRTLGMSIDSPSETDPTGSMPWYAVSANMVDPVGVVFNSELLNSAPHPWLTVRDMQGKVLSDRVAFIVMIPGVPQPGQSRLNSPNLGGASQYLDEIIVPPCTAPCISGTFTNYNSDESFVTGDEHRWIDDPANPGIQIEDSTYHFNDKLLYVTIDELMPLIEKRIAREVKSCLDSYAATSAAKYPWAAPVSDTASYLGTYNTLFGRISITPSNVITSDTTVPSFVDTLNQLQTALNTYNNQHNATNLSALILAGQTLQGLVDPAPSGIPSSVANPAENAAETAADLSTPTPSNPDLVNIQTSLNQAYTGLNNAGIIDGSMHTTWSCSLLTTPGNYWSDWKNLVYFQLAGGYRPGSVPACGSSCLTVYGSGNTNAGNGTYRAVVIVAGKKFLGQTRATPSANPPTDYLANNTSEISADPLFVTNAHDNASLTRTFITYKPADTYYQSVNDLILCLDGKGINPASLCQ